MAGRPVVIGVAGGIGSGKSAVARAFAALGCVVSDSDAQAREALERPEVIAAVASWWGPGVLDGSGRVDRGAVAKIVFSEARERARLEGLIHPMIRRSRGALIAEASALGAPGVVVDAPLLFEAGLDGECDAVVFVEASRATRLERVAGRGWDPAELDRREAAQMPLAQKRARSGYVVDNEGPGGEVALASAVSAILTDVRRRVAGG